MPAPWHSLGVAGRLGSRPCTTSHVHGLGQSGFGVQDLGLRHVECVIIDRWRNNRAELRMNANSDPTWISAATIGASIPKNARTIPMVSTLMVPKKLNMIT